jgi:cobalamin biosynthesis protein CobD/CbiB
MPLRSFKAAPPIYWHGRCSTILPEDINREEVRKMEMAWGMIMTAFTLFGMMALVIMSITMADEQKSGSAMRYTDEAAAAVPETRKAA